MRWVIGDIHGMLRSLATLVEAVGKLDAAAHFYFVGDYVNRGPDSKGVIDFLLELKNARFCRGNHDDVFDMVLSGQSFAPNGNLATPLEAYLTFMQYGLANTLSSYGAEWEALEEIERNPSDRRLLEVLQCVPETHRQFIHELEPVIEDVDAFVAHAMWDPDLPAEAPNIRWRVENNIPLRQQLLWGRYSAPQLTRKKRWKRTGYFGHTPVQNYAENLDGEINMPLMGNKIVLLDTAAALHPEGRLTAYCCETQRYIQTSPRGQLVLS
jgi:serine/threonine protein phosphatase 1